MNPKKTFSLAVLLSLTTAVIAASISFAAPNAATNPKREKPNLVLHISAKKTVWRVKGYESIDIFISNKGKQSVALVQAGDGSESGRRTPIIGWTIYKMDIRSKSFKVFKPEVVPGCGNYNPLNKGAVFAIAPGETRKLLNYWISFPSLTQAGLYKVRFSYSNWPKMKWSSGQLGPPDAKEMVRVRNSDECSLLSNELILTVKK